MSKKKRKDIKITEWGFRIPIQDDGLLMDIGQLPEEFLRYHRALEQRLFDDVFNPKPREPYVPPPETWTNCSGLYCPACGESGRVFRKSVDPDEEVVADPHRCGACDVEFDLWIVPR